jgi:hypothetical protein
MKLIRAISGLGVLLTVTLLGGPVAARAEAGEGAGRRTFGTTVTSHTVGAFAFTGREGADNAAVDFTVLSRSRFCSGAGCTLAASLFLPAGALVTSIQLDACDTNAAGGVTARLIRLPAREMAPGATLASTSTGLPGAMPGCAFFPKSLTSPEAIDNDDNVYNLEVVITGTSDASIRFSAVRVFYQLQVSPAPAAATFADVPTSHAFFKFIEALAAAGITGGCNASPPLYCPDDPVTRGQMAVFISRALGLHFVP